VEPVDPQQVKLLAAILYTDENLLEKSFSLLADSFGPIDFRSPVFPFTVSEYYHAEMGSPVHRIFIAFERLVEPGDLACLKIESNRIEDQLMIAGNRRVNVDTGYMDFDKVVLASAKYNGDKVYLAKGIWADLTLRYAKGEFHPYPWSFPDFKEGLYNKIFMEIRRRYKKQLKV
jgi:hypothetical protein